MENPFAEALASLNRPDYGKLSFEEKCAYYAALMLKVPPAAVAKVAGVNQSTISLLSGAGQVRGGQLRYPKIAREYDSLGHEAFVHRYLNPLIRDRLMVAIDQIKVAERNPDVNEKGYSPRANRYLGRHDWPETSIGLHAIFRIELHPDGGGYFWRNLKPFYDQAEIEPDKVGFHPACHLWGDPSRGPEHGPGAKGFATSELAYRHCKQTFDPKL